MSTSGKQRFEVGQTVPMTQNGEVVWECLAVDQRGAVLVDPEYRQEADVEALYPDAVPSQFGEALQPGAEGLVYANKYHVLKAHGHELTYSGAENDRLPHLRAAVALNYGLKAERPIIKGWRIGAPYILGAFISSRATELDPAVAVHDRMLSQRVPNLEGNAGPNPLCYNPLADLLTGLSERYSIHYIGHDPYGDNQLIARYRGRLTKGAVNIIDSFGFAEQPKAVDPALI